MSDTAIHRSVPRSMGRVDSWIWLALHVYAVVCLAGSADLSPHRTLAALSVFQLILTPALLYLLITRRALALDTRFFAVGSALFVLTSTAIYLASRMAPQSAFDWAFLWVLFKGIVCPFTIVAALLIWNVGTIFGLLKSNRAISAALVFLVSLALAGLTFSPKAWMWREVTWGLYYAAVDQVERSDDRTKQPSSIRRIQRGLDLGAELGGGSCQTEVYYTRAYSSLRDLSIQIAKLENFPLPDAVASRSLGLAERAKSIAPGYVLAYTCY